MESGCHRWDTDVVGPGGTGLWHHNSVASRSLTCVPTCHRETVVAAWAPPVSFADDPPTVATPTPFTCENCHWEQDITAGGHPSTYDHDPRGYYEYGRKIHSNKETHHMGQEGNVYPQCNIVCHAVVLDNPSWEFDDPELIRACEACHTKDTLHVIHTSGFSGWGAVGFHVPSNNKDESDLEPGMYRPFSTDGMCTSCHTSDVGEDKCPNDPKKIEPGICGCGVPDSDLDSDSDGTPDCVEDASPNGGDGNGDSIPDSQQPNVTSLQTYDGQGYVTLGSPPGTTITNCQCVGNPSPSDAPADVGFPFGFVSFTIGGVAPGAAASVVLSVHAGTTPDTYYKYGFTPGNHTNHWYEFMDDGNTGAEINGNEITLHFVNGDRGDDDLNSNNSVIVDIGGPGTAITAPSSNPTRAPSSPSAGGGSDGGGGGG